MLQAKERAQLIAAARLYYENNLTQAEVAQHLGVSRPLVSKLLTKAREVGIVHIEIRAGEDGEQNLLERLQLRYKLNGGLVLPAGRVPWEQVARYLAAETSADKYLGVGWGYTLGEALSSVEKGRLHGQTGLVYPLIGKAHFPNKGYHPDELVRLWAAASGRDACLMGCTAFPATEEERDELEKGAGFRQLQGLWMQSDAAIVGISDYPSVPDEATATRFGDALRKQRAVGSFLSYYYNERGEFISGNNDFCLHIPLALLRRCRKLVGVGVNAGTKAVAGALATGLFTHLVLREQQAKELL